jgi:hypothetical protein
LPESIQLVALEQRRAERRCRQLLKAMKEKGERDPRRSGENRVAAGHAKKAQEAGLPEPCQLPAVAERIAKQGVVRIPFRRVWC